MHVHDLLSETHATNIDLGYLASWDLSELDSTRKYFTMVNALKNKRDRDCIKLVESFDQKLERVYNDQTTDIEPISVGKAVDKVVNDGMVRIAEQVTNSLGLNAQLFTGSGQYIAIASGTGTNPVNSSDSSLQFENARVEFGSEGFALAAGTVMRFGGFFAPSIPSATISESGVFDDFSAGSMLYRTVYSALDQATHVLNNDYYTLSHAVYQVSV